MATRKHPAPARHLRWLIAVAWLVGAAHVSLAQEASRGDARLSVRVTLDPSLAAQVEPSDTVYVFARGLVGQGMPLSTVRTQADALPGTVVLDDSTGRMSAEKLSEHDQVEVVVRVSKSGDATARSGDLEGSTGPVLTGPDVAVEVVVNRVLSLPERARPPAEAPAHPQAHTAPRLELGPEVEAKWKSVTLADGEGPEFEVHIGRSAAVGSTDARVEVLSFVPAFKTDEGVVTTASNEPTNPAVLIRIIDSDGSRNEGWVFQNYPQFNTFSHQTLKIRLIEATAR